MDQHRAHERILYEHLEAAQGGKGPEPVALAEPLLLDGYEGMNQRIEKIQAVDRRRLPESVDRLVEFYTATNKPDEIKKWKVERAKYPAKPK